MPLAAVLQAWDATAANAAALAVCATTVLYCVQIYLVVRWALFVLLFSRDHDLDTKVADASDGCKPALYTVPMKVGS
jgi:hypothetical protein